MAIRAARMGAVLAVHGATWDFNVKKTRADYDEEFASNPIMARCHYEAIPPDSVTRALPDQDLAERLCDRSMSSPVTEDGGLAGWFVGDPLFEYYVHADLSLKRDSTGIAMCHYDPEADKTVVDLIWELKPDERWKLSFERVVHIVFSIQKLGFKIARMTFDGWQSFSTIERLVAAGIDSMPYSIDRGTEAYDTLISVLGSGKLRYGYHATFFKEMAELQLLEGKKYAHPEPNGSKDCADAVAGCVTQCTKSRMGLSLSDSEIQKAIHEEHVLFLSEVRLDYGPDSFGTAYAIDDVRQDSLVRGKPRVVRLDMTKYGELVVVLGWSDRENSKLYVDEYLVWENYQQPAAEFLENFVFALTRVFNVSAWSLGDQVPLEIVQVLQRTGRPVSTPLSTRVPGQHHHVAQSGQNLSGQAVRMMLQQIRRGVLTFPYCLPLQKDLRYATIDNLEERPYLSALASWCDFLTREEAFGRTGKRMPSAVSGEAARLSSAVGAQSQRGGIIHGRQYGSEIDRVRAQFGYTGGVTTRPIARQGDGNGPGKSLPRIRRG